jgi:hypothetical protein
MYKVGHTVLSHVDNELQIWQQHYQYFYTLCYELYCKLTTAKRDDAGDDVTSHEEATLL